ncbi:MAG: N-carbamoyl-D-amino-acid hydrolase [Pseudomonadota bacterium]
MSRVLTLAAAQMGPVGRDETREQAVARLITMLKDAKDRSADLVVFPELALTTFFPRWWFDDEAELDAFYETDMPNDATRPLFEAAADLQIGFYLGYAECCIDKGKKRRFNTSILVDRSGQIVGKYHKVHLPGHADHQDWRPFQHLEKRYFEPGDLGFPVVETQLGDVADARIGMCICNDRRWPETYRVMGLEGAEVILLGYNTPQHYPQAPEHDHLNNFHNHLVMQSGAYQNGCFVVGTAKCGMEEDCMLIGQSCIIAPTGEIVAMATSLSDEVITARCDLDRCRDIRDNIFNFDQHRRPECYGALTKQR